MQEKTHNHAFVTHPSPDFVHYITANTTFSSFRLPTPQHGRPLPRSSALQSAKINFEHLVNIIFQPREITFIESSYSLRHFVRGLGGSQPRNRLYRRLWDELYFLERVHTYIAGYKYYIYKSLHKQSIHLISYGPWQISPQVNKVD